MMFPFNIADVFHIPQDIRSQYEIRHERAAGNPDYRNSAVAMPLQQSIANLNQIEDRISSRIDKETASGTDMTYPLILLKAANQSVLDAEITINQATSRTTEGSMRPTYVQAHFALDQARDALSAVVDAITEATASSTLQ